jgi:hypothetical protein
VRQKRYDDILNRASPRPPPLKLRRGSPKHLRCEGGRTPQRRRSRGPRCPAPLPPALKLRRVAVALAEAGRRGAPVARQLRQGLRCSDATYQSRYEGTVVTFSGARSVRRKSPGSRTLQK